MSPIDTNALSMGLPATALLGQPVAPDGLGQTGSGPAAPADTIRYLPWGPNRAATGAPATANAASASPADGWNVASLMKAILDAVTQLLGRLGSLVQSAGALSDDSLPGSGESHFTNASAASVGDPHDSFSGTTQSGGSVSAHWDSMQAHDDLLSSDSFAGGYRVSTSVGPLNGGVTQNDRATVTADAGAASVTLSADGSYSALSEGRSLSLQTDRPLQFAPGATLSLNADRSLTVDDRTAAGGELRTTLRANGTGGVDVTNDAHDVDLGGYLVQKTGGAFA